MSELMDNVDREQERVKRTRYDNFHMSSAMLAAGMSHSTRGKVGVVIVRNDRVIVNGWNGTLPNNDNGCVAYKSTCVCGEAIEFVPSNTGWVAHCGCTISTVIITDSRPTGTECTRSDVMHAEENAIAYAAKTGIRLNGCTMYTTTMPCVRCARLIVACGITKVYYMNAHSDALGLDLLLNNSVAVVQLTDIKQEKS